MRSSRCGEEPQSEVRVARMEYEVFGTLSSVRSMDKWCRTRRASGGDWQEIGLSILGGVIRMEFVLALALDSAGHAVRGGCNLAATLGGGKGARGVATGAGCISVCQSWRVFCRLRRAPTGCLVGRYRAREGLGHVMPPAFRITFVRARNLS